MSHYKIQEKNLNVNDIYDIEDYFNCKVVSLQGMASQGEINGVVVEVFADAPKSNVYIHSNTDGSINRKTTNITLELFFNGKNRYFNYKRFSEYLEKRFVIISDLERNIQVECYTTKASTPQDNVLYGSEYLISTFVFENINGDFNLI